MIAVFQSSGKAPVVNDMLTICMAVSSTAGSMSLGRFVGIVSNSQVLFFMLSISLSIFCRSLVEDDEALELKC